MLYCENYVLFLSSLELDLSGNKLNQFPADMHVMQGIQVLNLSGNDLESVPPFVYSLPNLQELHLQNNCLMGKKLRVYCSKSSIPKVFTIIEACINFQLKVTLLQGNMNAFLFFLF